MLYSDSVSLEVHDSDAIVAAMSYVDVVLTLRTSFVLVDNASLDPFTHLMLPLYVHYPPLPLSVIICHMLISMICLKGCV